MKIEWDYVKKKTLWQYDDLLKKLHNVLQFEFVQAHYNHPMPAAINYAETMLVFLSAEKQRAFINQIIKNFETLDRLGIKDYTDLINRVSTRDKCESFIAEINFDFKELIETLHYLFRWVLPFSAYLNALTDNTGDKNYLDVLKECNIKTNLDALENLRTRQSRVEFSGKSAIPLAFVTEIVHRADVSRIAYVRGNTIKHLFGGGYDTLAKIANADPGKMVRDMTTYYAGIGKKFSDFKAVIPLDWMRGFARILPAVVLE